MKSNEIGQL